ncbi:hypothetical protein CAEBREN_24736 [Caenorhabditis brenneri]|uniref:Uncharacterized protein n=1 Tax=Caenorhabditis brenneri TaxID=135651 RepID=G0NXD8_CAEBE|nr:hypothetical protein CAEBREN_24736 [Caenorhabditis brenneri]
MLLGKVSPTAQLLKIEKALRDAQLKFSQGTGKEEYPIITFGSNIDIDDAPEKVDAMKNPPEFTRPKQRLMSILKDKLYGINLVQAYVKRPGCRTVAHRYGISMKHIAGLEAL